jgi:hypothetical protein
MRLAPRLYRARAVAVLSFGLLLTVSLSAEESTTQGESPCRSTLVSSVPSRPTVSNATDTTQCGVAEMEYGVERQWQGAGAGHSDFAGGLRFGITPRLDFHWASADFMSITDSGGNRQGFGDTWLGLKYKISPQRKYVPSFGVFYSAKVPSASDRNGMGTGQVDHSLSFLASKDVRRVHFDFNVIELLAGRPTAPGVDHNTGLSLASWVTVTPRLSVVVEPYGYTSLNPSSPAFASTMVGFNYKVQPRVFLDAGLDLGVTPDAPHKRVYFGVTCAVANLYRQFRADR